MKIHPKNQINKSASSTETTIIIANTKYTVNAVPITQVEAGNNILQYKAIGKFSHEERLLLNDSLKQAYIYINDTYRTLQKLSTQTLERLEAILGDMEDAELETLISQIEQIQDKILSDKLVVLKENYLDTEKDHVLASVKEDDTYTFTVYDNFFDKKEFKDNRAGVIIHELCHLCNIEEGADMYDMDSAECLKNIILCLCEKLTLKQIRQEYARKQVPQERNDDTLTYDENQPRVEKGNPNGGQWTKGGSNGGKSSKDDKNSSSSKGKNSEDSELEEKESSKNEDAEVELPEEENREENSEERQKEIEEAQAEIFQGILDETRNFLEEKGYSDSEIDKELDGIDREGVKGIYKRESGDINAAILKSIKDMGAGKIPLIASNGNLADVFLSRMSSSPQTSKIVEIFREFDSKEKNTEENKLKNFIEKLDDLKSKIDKTDIITLAPGIRVVNNTKGVIGIAIDLTGKEELSLFEGQLVLSGFTSVAICVDDKKNLLVESSKDIRVYKSIFKVGSFSKLKIDMEGNIVDSDVNGFLIIPASSVVNGLQEAIHDAIK